MHGYLPGDHGLTTIYNNSAEQASCGPSCNLLKQHWSIEDDGIDALYAYPLLSSPCTRSFIFAKIAAIALIRLCALSNAYSAEHYMLQSNAYSAEHHMLHF